ncbi:MULTISPECIES: carboxypeptidase-like regulatory domain-containing protein [Flavobacterium]|uniref:Carboxypeptidase-like regulatory domain-containing protein n=1 Tax=Flavobacterium jumunjinense TaxID=998845 RepID=A0ABV5GP55_9FLAO|nr:MULTISPECIES: carboxypeptidase-like regulatory domain-containing protein [Flavobacterium]
MSQNFNLAIENPCSENFNNFNSTEKGGFCNSCRKEVVNFTNMTDSQIIDYFKNSTKKTCGYFREEQLKNYASQITISQQKGKFWNASIMGFSLLSLLSFTNGLAQEDTSNMTTHKVQTDKKKVDNTTSNNQNLQELTSGVVYDESRIPLPGASITLKGSNIGVITNFDGEFTFPKPLEKETILIVSYLGYETKEVKILNSKKIVIKLDSPMAILMMGEVAVEKVYQSKPTFFQRIGNFFKK